VPWEIYLILVLAVITGSIIGTLEAYSILKEEDNGNME